MTPEERKAKNRAYYLAHQERIKERSRAYSREHSEEIKAKRQARYADDPDMYKRWQHAYLEHSREKVRASTKRRNAALREKTFAAYGGMCTCCGEDYLPYLELDHVNNDGAAHRAAVGLSRTAGPAFYRLLEREGYPNYIQILCGNCHNAKTKRFPCRVH